MKKSILFFLFLFSTFSQLIYGEDWTLKKLSLKGNTLFSEQKILEQMDFRKNQRFPEKNLEQMIEKVIKLYEENGFPFCQIVPSNFEKGEKELSLSLNITEGPEVHIRKIYLEGLNKTSPWVIYREIQIDSADVFYQRKIEAALQRLKRKNFIEEVKEEMETEKDPSWVSLKFKIKERKSNSFEGILGYVPSFGNTKSFFTGKAGLILDNILGTGRRGELRWSGKDAYSSDFALSYQEPWLFGFPPTWKFNLRQTDYDSTYLYWNVNSELEFPLSEKLNWKIGIGWEKVVPQEKGKIIISPSRKYSFNLGAVLEMLDFPENPLKGIFYQTSLTYSKKRNYPTSDLIPEKEIVYDTKFSLQMSHFIPTLNRQTLGLSFNLKGIVSDEKVIPISEQFKIGGLNTLRGYREEEFSGDKVLWINWEYRFLPSKYYRLFLFLDWGYFSKNIRTSPNELMKLEKNRLGYGFGLNLKSQMGIFALSFGWGQEDKFSSGKIHFGISNRF